VLNGMAEQIGWHGVILPQPASPVRPRTPDGLEVGGTGGNNSAGGQPEVYALSTLLPPVAAVADVSPGA
jgi:hypothetical protein